MKKILLALSMLTMSVTAQAEGYQVNVQSARQTGMGHVGVAQKLGAESQHFNPAGLGFMNKTVDVSLGMGAIFAKAKYETTLTNGTKFESKNNVGASTPMYAYAGFKVYDNLSFGFSVNTPYGSSLDWGKNWVGAHLVQDIKLQAFNIQPTVAYRLCDKLSIGAGLMINTGNVELSRAVMPVNSYPGLDGIAPVSATLSGDAKVAFGYNVGIMYDVNDKLTIGASYKSKTILKVEEGTADVSYANPQLQEAIATVGEAGVTTNPLFPVYVTTKAMTDGIFKAEMPMPANLLVGASYDVNDKLTLAADLQVTFWSAYDSLNISFLPKTIPTIESPKHYDNSYAVRLGAEYAITERTDLRAGVYFDKTPINKNLYNPETPGMDKLGFSIGASFRPTERFSVDFAMLCIVGLGIDGSTPNVVNPLDGKEFSGSYSSVAYAPTLGFSYSF